MSVNAKKNADAESQATFNIQVCSEEGQLLSEYTLTKHDHDIRTLKAAESCACESLSDYQGEPLVVVVSEQTLTKLRQVQTDCQFGRDNPPEKPTET